MSLQAQQTLEKGCFARSVFAHNPVHAFRLKTGLNIIQDLMVSV
jgi:hypothetical protein